MDATIHKNLDQFRKLRDFAQTSKTNPIHIIGVAVSTVEAGSAD